MASSGHAWQDEIQSFLPHALDCVDPSCLLPLCVNLKLTLRHVQQCEKLDQCTICHGMKSLAASHSNSCRDYFCRVPFCMEAKVTTQQQILMDELVKTSPGKDLYGKGDSDFNKAEGEKSPNDGSSTKTADSSTTHIPEIRKAATPGKQTMVSRSEGCAENVQSACRDVVWAMTKCPSPSSKVISQVSRVLGGNTVQLESKGQSHFLQVVEGSLKSFQPSSQIPEQSSMSGERGWPIPSPKSPASHLKPPCQPGTKRKLTSLLSINNKSISAPKAYRSASEVTSSGIDDSPEVEEIINRKLGGSSVFEIAVPETPTVHSKPQSTSISELSETSLKHDAFKRTRQRPDHSINRRPPSAPSNLRLKPATFVSKGRSKAASGDGKYDSSGMDLQIVDDGVDPYVDDLFWTPPPSPTFEMWFGEPVRTNDTVLKSVLLDTLFQLLGLVTQPKTKQQEAILVDLLERTLRVMKTEIAKQ